MTDEEKVDKGTKDTTDAEKDGVQSETDKQVEQLEADTERINKALAENENAKARERLAGKAEAGAEPVKTEETPQEYSKRIMAGEHDG